MSIATQIERLKQAKADIKNAIEEKGVEVGDGTIDTFAQKIGEITGGGSGGGTADGCVTITFISDGNVIFRRPVYIGDDCPDPITQGHITTPIKESTPQYNYTYKGWSDTEGGTVNSAILKNITEDKTIYATYTETVRKYTITFYDADGATILHTEQVAYGGDSTYIHRKDGYMFCGWTPEPSNITSDISCVGAWEESLAFADASWEYIAQIAESGNASKVFSLGDVKEVDIVIKDGTLRTIPFQIVGFNHDDLADGTGKAGISVVSVPAVDMYMLSAKPFDDNLWIASTGKYPTKMHVGLNGYLYERMPADLVPYIKPVNKVSSTAYKYVSSTDPNHTLVTTVDKLWVLGASEVTDEMLTNTVMPPDGTLYEYFETPENRIKYIEQLDGMNETRDRYSLRSFGRAENSSAAMLAVYNTGTEAGKLGRGSYQEFPIGFCL